MKSSRRLRSDLNQLITFHYINSKVSGLHTHCCLGLWRDWWVSVDILARSIYTNISLKVDPGYNVCQKIQDSCNTRCLLMNYKTWSPPVVCASSLRRWWGRWEMRRQLPWQPCRVCSHRYRMCPSNNLQHTHVDTAHVLQIMHMDINTEHIFQINCNILSVISWYANCPYSHQTNHWNLRNFCISYSQDIKSSYFDIINSLCVDYVYCLH